jgi:hypothetical protein
MADVVRDVELGISIEPSRAEAGAEVVSRSLDDVKHKADELGPASEKAAASFERLGNIEGIRGLQRGIINSTVSLKELEAEIAKTRAAGGPIPPEMTAQIEQYKLQLEEAKTKLIEFRETQHAVVDEMRLGAAGITGPLAEAFSTGLAKMAAYTGGFLLLEEGGKKMWEALKLVKETMDKIGDAVTEHRHKLAEQAEDYTNIALAMNAASTGEVGYIARIQQANAIVEEQRNVHSKVQQALKITTDVSLAAAASQTPLGIALEEVTKRVDEDRVALEARRAALEAFSQDNDITVTGLHHFADAVKDSVGTVPKTFEEVKNAAEDMAATLRVALQVGTADFLDYAHAYESKFPEILAYYKRHGQEVPENITKAINALADEKKALEQHVPVLKAVEEGLHKNRDAEKEHRDAIAQKLEVMREQFTLQEKIGAEVDKLIEKAEHEIASGKSEVAVKEELQKALDALVTKYGVEGKYVEELVAKHNAYKTAVEAAKNADESRAPAIDHITAGVLASAEAHEKARTDVEALTAKIAASTAGYGGYGDATKRAADDTKQFDESLASMNKEGQATGVFIATLRGTVSDFAGTIEGLTGKLSAQQQALLAHAADIDGLVQHYIASGKEIPEALQKTKNALDEARDHVKLLKDEVADNSALNDFVLKIAKGSESASTLGKALLDTGGDAKTFTASVIDTVNALKLAAAANDNVGEKARLNAAAVTLLKNALTSLKDAGAGDSEQVRQLESALEFLSSGAEKAAAHVKKLADANRDLANAEKEAGDAARDAAQGIESNDAQLLASSSALQIDSSKMSDARKGEIDQLNKIADSTGILSTYIKTLIAAYGNERIGAGLLKSTLDELLHSQFEMLDASDGKAIGQFAAALFKAQQAADATKNSVSQLAASSAEAGAAMELISSKADHLGSSVAQAAKGMQSSFDGVTQSVTKVGSAIDGVVKQLSDMAKKNREAAATMLPPWSAPNMRPGGTTLGDQATQWGGR